MTDSTTAVADRLRIAVVGAGAVGGIFGARLTLAGHEVTFVVRPGTASVLHRDGLRIDSVQGDVHLPVVTTAIDPAVVGPVDVVLVCVKATQVAALAPSLRPLLAPHTLVVPTQNGVEAGVQLAAALGHGAVSDGVCRVIAELAAPGHVRHMAVTPLLEFGARATGPLDAAVRSTVDRFAAALSGAGLAALVPADMGVALWEKFLFIEPMGVVGAVARQPYGVLRRVPETRALLDAALEEVMAVGTAAGIAWPSEAKARVWQRYDALPAGGYTSMARDLMAGRPSEYEAQTGAVIRLAGTLGVTVPVHTVLHAVLTPTAVAAS